MGVGGSLAALPSEEGNFWGVIPMLQDVQRGNDEVDEGDE
jgi:hypothetical protein